MILNKEDEFLNSLPGRSQALGVTLGQAASPRPGMQPAWAAPCPNQFEPAVGMEPWRVPTSSLWRPRRAQSGCCGLLLGSPPRGQAAGSLPAGGRGARGRLAPKTPPGAAVAPGWAPRPHILPPPHPRPIWLHLQLQNGCLSVSFQGHLCQLRPQAHRVLGAYRSQARLRLGNFQKILTPRPLPSDWDLIGRGRGLGWGG